MNVNSELSLQSPAPLLKAARGYSAAIMLLPFLVFYWMLPYVSGNTIGNDYQHFAVDHQLELMFSIKNGSFPLYAPGFAGGQTASALTQGQIFHPLPYLASLLPGYWTGKPQVCVTAIRLLSLGLVHLYLFALLRRMVPGNFWAFVLSLATAYNLRMLDLFRYGSSFESWTGVLLVCTAIGFLFVKPPSSIVSLPIAAATYWLVCSGHPQMMYYGLIGAFFFAILLPFFLSESASEPKPGIRFILRMWCRIGISSSMGFLLACVYIFPFYFDFLASNAGRVDQTYAWANSHLDTIMGTLNNFFNPMLSDVSGVFGGAPFFFICLLLPVLTAVKKKLPLFVWVTWGLVVLVFLHMQGSRTLVHLLVWKYLPMASAFRVPGRVSMVLPILYLLLSLWLLRQPRLNLQIWKRNIQLEMIVVPATAALFLFGLYLLLPDSIRSDDTVYSARSIRNLSPGMIWCVTATGFSTLCGIIAIAAGRRQAGTIAKPILAALLVFQLGLLVYNGTWKAARIDKPSLQVMQEQKQQELVFRMETGSGLRSKTVVEQIDNAFLEPYLAKVYYKYQFVKDTTEAYAGMRIFRREDTLTIIQPDTAGTFPAESLENAAGSVDLIYSTYNRMAFRVESTSAGMLEFAYPFTGHWRASVSGEPADIYRVNGSAHAVVIRPGKQVVAFEYHSWSALWGTAVSFFTLAFLIFLLGRRLAIPFAVPFVLAAAIGIGGFYMWYHSLYTGANLETQYRWQSHPYAKDGNIAYGKQTAMSSALLSIYPRYLTSEKAIDGYRKAGSGFIAGRQRSPWWLVDLNKLETISRIVVYEGRFDRDLNRRPMAVHFSTDRKKWITAGQLPDRQPGNPGIITFDPPKQARYIMLKASQDCYLSFDEVEVYTVLPDSG